MYDLFLLEYKYNIFNSHLNFGVLCSGRDFNCCHKGSSL